MARLITDNFNRANAGSLGSSSEGWSWSAVLGTSSIVSNQANGVSTNCRARADQDLDSVDMFAQATYKGDATASTQGNVCVRYDPSADTCYYFTMRVDGTSTRIIKVIAGTPTTLVTSTTTGITSGDVVRCEIRGQLIIGFLNGTEVTRVRDSSILTGVRAGISMVAGSANLSKLDDFSAGSLGMPNFFVFFGEKP